MPISTNNVGSIASDPRSVGREMEKQACVIELIRDWLQGQYLCLANDMWYMVVYTNLTLYEGPNLANQICRKLGIFDRKLLHILLLCFD